MTADSIGSPASLQSCLPSAYLRTVVFCAPDALPDGVELELLRAERAVVHLPAGHRLASGPSVTLQYLADETVLVAGGDESGGFSARVLGAFAAPGIAPRTAGPVPRPRRARGPRRRRHRDLRAQRVCGATTGIGVRDARAAADPAVRARVAPGFAHAYPRCRARAVRAAAPLD